MTGVGDSCMSIPLALIAFSNGANFEYFLFGTFVFIILFGVLTLNIVPTWAWKGTRPMRLGSGRGLDTGVI